MGNETGVFPHSQKERHSHLKILNCAIVNVQKYSKGVHIIVMSDHDSMSRGTYEDLRGKLKQPKLADGGVVVPGKPGR